MTTSRFQIIRTQPFFDNSLRNLPTAINTEINKIERVLEIDPFLIAKPLRAPLQGRYAIRILGRKYRIICRIDIHTHRVYLDYVRPRSTAYLL